MKHSVLAPIAAVTFALALTACGSDPSSSSPQLQGAPQAAGASDFCVVAQNIVTDQDGVAVAIRAIATNTVSGPDMATPEGWANRQVLAQGAIDAANALIDQYSAAILLVTDPAVSDALTQAAQFYEESVLTGNQKILTFSDQTSFLTSGDDRAVTTAPTAAMAAVQTYITDQCGFLLP